MRSGRSSSTMVTVVDDDAARMEQYGEKLALAVDVVIGDWIEASVARVARAQLGSVPDDLADAARTAGEAARSEVSTALAALLATDIDDQVTTPLAIVRQAGAHATRVLREAGISPVGRDPFSEERFPADVYGIGPARLVELSEGCHEAGIAWGAAKAHLHRSRHRTEPRARP